jgi:putative flippase GtrA
LADDIHIEEPVVVPIPQDPFLPRRRLQGILDLFPPGQFLRYLCVGGFNTAFGYATFALVLTLLNRFVPQHLLYLTAIMASLISTPLNITVAYFGYKIFVFKTNGNYLIEWLKAFAVYGTGMVPGLVALGALTRLLQGLTQKHSQSGASGKAVAGYIAGAIVIGISTIYSFVGHKKVTFKPASKP